MPANDRSRAALRRRPGTDDVAASMSPDRLAESRWSVVRAFIRSLHDLPAKDWVSSVSVADESEMDAMLVALAEAQRLVGEHLLVMAHRQLRSSVALAARAAVLRAESVEERSQISAAAVLAEWSALALLVRPYFRRQEFGDLYRPFRGLIDPERLEYAASLERTRALAEREDAGAQHDGGE